MADDSFERFYTATYARLLRQLALVTGDRGDAEELLQEAFGRAALRWRRLSDYEAPEAWVRRVAMRLAADRARRARRRAAALLRLRPPLQPAADLSVESLDLASSMRRLSVGQRQAIVLHHLVGLSVGEVAGQLGIPVGTVKTRLARGRAALARHLEVKDDQVVGNDG